jgi:hypothetical protein
VAAARGAPAQQQRAAGGQRGDRDAAGAERRLHEQAVGRDVVVDEGAQPDAAGGVDEQQGLAGTGQQDGHVRLPAGR